MAQDRGAMGMRIETLDFQKHAGGRRSPVPAGERDTMNKQRLIEKRIHAQHRISAERLRQDPEQVLGHARRDLERCAERYDRAERPCRIEKWRHLPGPPLERVVDVLTSGSEEARRLRSSSPCAGVLSARGRWALYKEIDDKAS